MESVLVVCQGMWRSGDCTGYADLFASNGTFTNPVLESPVRGREAIRTLSATFPQLENQTEWLSIDGNRLVFGWSERQMEMRADAPSYRGFSTYVFNDDGLIASYEGMFDPAAVEAATAP
jgi:hypothetical protein